MHLYLMLFMYIIEANVLFLLQFETWNGIKPLFSDALDAVVGKESTAQ